MKIFLDTADVSEIAKAYETGMIDGVTTNPSLIKKSGRDPLEVAKEIYNSFPLLESISCEVVADTIFEMVAQAVQYYEIGPRITIKVPCTVEGLKACRFLSEKGVSTNVTLVFNAAQAILAAKSGATYVSPFVGRLDDQSIAGLEVVRSIAEMYGRHGVKTQVLAASIRDVHRAVRSWYNGADICTIPPSVFWKMYEHVLTDRGLEIFQLDFELSRLKN